MSLEHSTAEITIVRGWLAAANEQDVERMLALSLPDIAFQGSAVSGSGRPALREWMAVADESFAPERVFQRDDSVVLASYPAAAVVGSDVARRLTGPALRFRVRELRVVEVERFDDLAIALAAAGLSPADEHPSQH